MARSVCDADPRRIDQRRANALIAAVTHTAFGCTCGEPDCTGGTAGDAPAKNAVVYAVADEKSVDAATAAQESDADDRARRALPDPEPPRASAKPAYVFGAGIMPTALLGGILERARIREVRHPGENSAPEPRYTPSTALCRVRALPRSDVPVPWLRQTRPGLRYRPHRGLPGRADTSVEPEVPVPLSPFTENVLERPGRLARPTTTRRHRHLDQPDRPHLHHLPRQPAPVPAACVNRPPRCGPANHPPPNPPATAAP